MNLSSRYTLKVLSLYDDKAMKRWANNTIVSQGHQRPNWVKYTLAKLSVIRMPMSTWNLNFVNI